MAFVRASELLDEETRTSKGLVLVDIDFRDGAFGPEVMYELKDAQGNEYTVTLARTPGREAQAVKLAEALNASLSGTVPITFYEIDTKKSKTGKSVQIAEFNSGGRGPSALRARVAQRTGVVVPTEAGNDDTDKPF